MSRAAACVNACAGIEDPETTVPRLITVLKRMVSAFNVEEIEPVVAFATIEQARAVLEKLEETK